MERFQSIQMLRALAALGVVLFHCIPIEGKYFANAKVLPGMFEMGQSGVDLFFAISGFVMVATTKGRHGVLGEIWRFLWARLTRIYPTYWFYFLLVAGVFLVRPDWVNASQGHQTDLIASFFLMPSNRLPLVMVAWSLIHELWFYLVFALFLAFPERLLVLLLLSWAFVVTAASFVVALAELPPALRIAVHPYTIEFIIGAFSALLSQGMRRSLTKRQFVMAVTLIFFGLVFAAHFDIFNRSSLTRALSFGLLYGAVIYAFVGAERSGWLQVPRLLLMIGNSSYSVYLSHLLVLSVIGRLWAMRFPEASNPVVTAVVFPAMLAAVIVYGWVAYRFIELPVLRLSHQLAARWFSRSETRG